MAVSRDIIGRKSPVFVSTVETGKIKEFAAAIGDDSDFYWDDDRAGGLCVPPTLSHVFRSGKMQLLMSDCGLDATKFLHGEHDIVYARPLRPGDRLTYQITVVDVIEAHGRRSGVMDIVVLETLVRDTAGELVQTIRQSFVAKR